MFGLDKDETQALRHKNGIMTAHFYGEDHLQGPPPFALSGEVVLDHLQDHLPGPPPSACCGGFLEVVLATFLEGFKQTSE